MLAPEALTAYFQQVYWQRGDALDRMGLLQMHRDHLHSLSFPFQTIADQFRMIESYLKPVIVPYDDDAKKQVERLRVAETVGDIPRKLQPYLVQVPHKTLLELQRSGGVELIAQETFGEQFWVLSASSLYDPEAGLRLDSPELLVAEQSVL